MKKIVFGITVSVLAVSLLVGATKAYFSSLETVAGNTIASGTLVYHINSSVGKPISLSGLKPGDQSSWASITMLNSGSLPLMPYFYIGDKTGDTGLFNTLEIEINDSGNDAVCGNGDDVSYYNGLISGVEGVVNKKLINKDPDWGGSDSMPVGAAQIVCQRVHFPDTGSDQNSLQGKTVGFIEYFYGAQVL